jgi:predicted ATPase
MLLCNRALPILNRCAAVAGVEFSLELLRTLLPPRVAEQLELLVQSLVSSRFAHHSRYDYYRFRNTLVHRMIYTLIPASARQQMHR